MVVSNTVLKVNIKAQGESLVWLFGDPTIEESEAERLFPRITDRVYGPNLTFVCTRLTKKSLFLSTTSAWSSEDEFERKGITLSQGLLINGDLSHPDHRADVCNSLAILLRIHRTRYHTLGELLEHLAAQGNVAEARKIAAETYDSLSNADSGCATQPVQPLAGHLKAMLDKQNIRLRVDTKFPWSEELGFFVLMWLQFLSENVHSVAGGQLISSGSYDHISTSQEVPGFRYIDLNQLLTPRVKTESTLTSPVGGESEWRDTSLRKVLWSKLSLLNTLLFLAVLILCLCTYFMLQQKELLRKIETITDVIGQTRKNAPVEAQENTLSPEKPQAADLSQEDVTLKQTIAKMYAADPTTRGNAILQLKQDKTSHERMVPLAIRYALENPKDPNGVENTFLVLQKCDPKILKKNKDEVARFLDLVKKIDGSKATAADRMKTLINQP
jgi:hypothetical protein